MSEAFPQAGELLLGAAVLLLLLSITPPRAAYALGPHVGNAFVRGRLAFAGAGVAVAVGLGITLGLGGTL